MSSSPTLKFNSADYAQVYEDELGPILFAPTAAHVAERVAAACGDSACRLLEIGSGTGRLTRLLRSRCGEQLAITATDISPAMLAVAERTVGGGVHFACLAAEQLSASYAADSFDLAVGQFVLMFVDQPAALRQLHHVLRPGGRLYLTTWDSMSSMQLFQAQIDIRAVNEAAYHAMHRPFSLADPDALRALLQDAGFVDVAVERVDLTGTSRSSAADFAARFTQTASILDGCTAEQRRAYTDAFAAALQRRADCTADSFTTNLSFFVCTAGK